MLLGATYRSSEQAIQELVDNAWDADAEHVWITLPDAVTADPVIVRDDGSGMTDQQVRNEYLKIARDRRATKGDRTPGKHRTVRSRSGPALRDAIRRFEQTGSSVITDASRRNHLDPNFDRLTDWRSPAMASSGFGDSNLCSSG